MVCAKVLKTVGFAFPLIDKSTFTLKEMKCHIEGFLAVRAHTCHQMPFQFKGLWTKTRQKQLIVALEPFVFVFAWLSKSTTSTDYFILLKCLVRHYLSINLFIHQNTPWQILTKVLPTDKKSPLLLQQHQLQFERPEQAGHNLLYTVDILSPEVFFMLASLSFVSRNQITKSMIIEHTHSFSVKVVYAIGNM